MEELKLNGSKFTDILFTAYDIANNKYIINNKKKIFKDKKLKDYSLMDDSIMSNFITSYMDFLQDIKNLNDNNFAQIIESFGHFLRIAEKCNYYRNDNTDDIYSEITDKFCKVVLFENDVIYQILIEKTKIADLNVNYDPLNHILPLSESEPVSFVKITIDRNYGNKMCNTFKYLSSSKPIFNDRSDEVLYNNMLKKISYYIIKIFDGIINSIFKNSNIEYMDPRKVSKENLIIEDMIKYELWKYNE